MNATRTIELTPECIARFWSKVDKNGPVPEHRPDIGPCWLWTGEKHTNRYGIYSQWGNSRRLSKFYAHRLSLLIAGHSLDGLVARHDCDNPPCVNPNHLRPGTQADNFRDSLERNRANTTGLAVGRGPWPPRPCRRCGTTVTAGHRRYCPPCRLVTTQEQKRRWSEKNRVTA